MDAADGKAGDGAADVDEPKAMRATHSNGLWDLKEKTDISKRHTGLQRGLESMLTHIAGGVDGYVSKRASHAGHAGEHAAEGAGLEHGDDIGRHRVRLCPDHRGIWLEHVAVCLEEEQEDGVAGDAVVVAKAEYALVNDEREPWRRRVRWLSRIRYEQGEGARAESGTK
jgi:hypothetical protein